MNTVNNLFEQITDKNNIGLAIQNAAKGKRKKESVNRILKNTFIHAEALSSRLKSGEWRPERIHKVHTINDGISLKKREIVCPRFLNELVVNHAIFQVCKPIFMKRFYKYSCASVPGRGVEYAIKHIRKAAKDRKNTKYFSVIDIYHFFDSVKPSKVFHQLRRIIRDRKTLMLFAHILRGNKVDSPSNGITKRGMPIGFYSSQWLANLLLTPLDNMIKANGIKYYYRYNDDMLLFCSNKRKLKKVIGLIESFLQSISLSVKRPPQIHCFSKVPIRYIGAIIYPHKVILQEKVFLKACRTARRIGRKKRMTIYDARKMLSYSSKFSHYDTYKAYHEKLEANVPRKKCRVLISNYERRKRLCGISQTQT